MKVRRRRRTLRGRVSLVALAVIAGWLVVLTVIFNVVLSRRLESQTNGTLRIRAEAASSTLDVSSTGRVTVRESTTDRALDSSTWVYVGRVAVERPGRDKDLQTAADKLAGSGSRFYDAAPDARFYALAIRHRGRQVATVVAAVSTEQYHDAAHAALLGSALVSLLVLIGAYPVLRIVASRALRPVDKMTGQAAEWSARSPDQRFGSGQQFEELQGLAINLDALLDRLAAVLRHERQLSAELSHELRTPLAHICAELDIMLARAESSDGDALAHKQIRERVDAMDRIIETLLSTARIEHSDGPPGACSVEVVLSRAITSIQAGVEIHYAPSPIVAGVNADILERVVRPVLDNAARYAASAVTIRVGRHMSLIAIDISNDGPALDPALAERVFDPGFRADDADAHPGVGLGLALSRRLARSADGDVTALPETARTTFRILLPPA